MSKESTPLIDIPELPPSVDNAVKNLTDKPTQAMGTTFSDIWYLVFGGISYLSEKKKIKYAHNLEQYRIQLESAIDQIPTEKRIEPSVQTTAQALENSKYCVEEETLRNMFTALISNSMNSDYEKDIHPSFAEIIKQMSSMDAEVIKVFKNSPSNGYALCRYEIKENGSYRTLMDNVFLKYPTPNLATCSISISSLARLGLLKTSYEDYLIGDNLYTAFTEHYWFKRLQQEFPNKNVAIQKGLVHLTPLGRAFTRVCIPD